MRKRLAVEGDGGGDDRRVMSLLKTFVRWCNSKGLSDEESEATYQKMLFTLGMYVWGGCDLIDLNEKEVIDKMVKGFATSTSRTSLVTQPP